MYETTDFFGRTHIRRSNGRPGAIVDRIRYLLERDEACRNSINEMLISLWMQDGLDNVIPPECHDGLVRFVVGQATNAKTAINRYQDLQRDYDYLAPSPDVAERRRQGAGW